MAASGAHLLVKMLKADGLMAMEHGTASPYLKVSLDKLRSHKTTKVHHSLSPNWPEQFTFDAADVAAAHKLVLSIKHARMGFDKRMGFVEVALGAMDQSGQLVQTWYNLDKAPKMDKAVSAPQPSARHAVPPASATSCHVLRCHTTAIVAVLTLHDVGSSSAAKRACAHRLPVRAPGGRAYVCHSRGCSV